MSKRLRVVLLARSFEIGGAEVQLAALAKGLRGTEITPSVACFYPRGPLLAELESARLTPLSLRKRGRWDLLGPVAALRRVLADLRPHVVHSFLTPPNILAALARPDAVGARLVWGLRASNMDLSRYDWTFRLSEFAERRLARRADAIIANSLAGQAHAQRRGYPATRMTVIHNGIDTERFAPDPAARAAVRAQWDFGPEAWVVGLVARLDPMKDHDTFLRAAAIACRRNPRIALVCVGDGPAQYREGLRARAASLGVDGRVHWAGQRRDMPAVFNAMDAVTLTSAFGEGFPNTLGEAMACGVPCVATDVGDAALILDGTGTIVSVGDAAGLAAGWQAFATEARDAYAARKAACRHKIERAFSLDRMVEQHAALYQRLASAGAD